MCHKSLLLATLLEKDFCILTRVASPYSRLLWHRPKQLHFCKCHSLHCRIRLQQLDFSTCQSFLLSATYFAMDKKHFTFFKYFTVQNVCTENFALLHISLIPTLSATFLHRKVLQKQFPCVFHVPVEHFTLSQILTKLWHSSQPWATCNVQYSFRNFCIPARVTRPYS